MTATIKTLQELMEDEAKILRPYAVFGVRSRGRAYPEEETKGRLPFQKDRDRIIHCRAFRRLKDKTQVFVAHHGDHYRNRLTHSLEVAQISRDTARSLGLNEDLAEAIALAHDLGHTPFGHAGEFALDKCLREHGLHFEHNEQSLRIVTELEDVYPDFPGLNLSFEVLEGLRKHDESVPHSLEAQLVDHADEIAYQNHDIDDGLRSGLFTEADLSQVPLWKEVTERVRKRFGDLPDERIRWSRCISELISWMISDLSEATCRRLNEKNIRSTEDVYASRETLVDFSKDLTSENKKLKAFLMARLYQHPEVKKHIEEGQDLIRLLFHHYLAEGREVGWIRDYLSGMTDSYARTEMKALGLE